MKITFKKILSIIFSIIMVFSISVSSFVASAKSFDELTDAFTVYKAENGMKYASYEPETEEGKTYPLVIYVHGLGHAWTDTTFKQSGLTYWVDDEMQAKFKEGGAYLLMPKIPETSITALQTEKVFSVINEYVNAHSDTIDKNQIYIIGGSAGGALTWRIIIAHPDYFAKAVVLCGCKILTNDEAKKIADIPVWMISAKTDPLVWYPVFSAPNWNTLTKNSNIKSQLRHTIFKSSVQLPDGSHPLLSHLLAKTIGWNLCIISDNQPLDGMDIVDGNGNVVDISFDDGIIEWLQSNFE